MQIIQPTHLVGFVKVLVFFRNKLFCDQIVLVMRDGVMQKANRGALYVSVQEHVNNRLVIAGQRVTERSESVLHSCRNSQIRFSHQQRFLASQRP